MRIALVIEHFDPACGGAERNLVEATHHLLSRGHEVTILCAGGVRRLPEPDHQVRIERCPSGKTRSALGLWRFSRWVARRVFDGSFDASLSVTTAAPATVLQPLGGSVRETLLRNIAIRPSVAGRTAKRAANLLSPKRQMMLWLERQTLSDPRVRFIAAISDYVVRQFREHYGVGEDRVVLVPNAVELPAVSAEDRQAWRRQVRRAFSIADDTVVYLFAAFNPRLKGAGPLLQALALLRKRGVNAVVMMAGPIGYREQHLAAQLHVRSYVKMVGTTQQMPKLYCAADVTAVPTFYDSSSRVVIESLMLGVPAITTRFAGASDLIDRGGGRLGGRVIADPHDVEALSGAMAELADADERARCRAALAGIAAELTCTAHVSELERLLQQSVGAHG